MYVHEVELADPDGQNLSLKARVFAKSLQLCPTLCDPMYLQPSRILCPWDSPGKNTGVGCHALLQGIFPTQGLNPCLMFPALAGFPLSGPVEKSTVVSHLVFLPKNLTVNLTKKKKKMLLTFVNCFTFSYKDCRQAEGRQQRSPCPVSHSVPADLRLPGLHQKYIHSWKHYYRCSHCKRGKT